MLVRLRQPLTTSPLQVASVLILVVLASASLGAVPVQKSQCPAEEGAAVATRFGLSVCAGPTATTVITHDERQRGARIVALDPEGAGAQEGLAAGDIIYQVAGTRVESGKAAIEALDAARDQRIVLINYWRDGAPFIARIWKE